jgi:hypothetical protein
MLREVVDRNCVSGFDVRQHARKESISKRAPSITGDSPHGIVSVLGDIHSSMF